MAFLLIVAANVLYLRHMGEWPCMLVILPAGVLTVALNHFGKRKMKLDSGQALVKSASDGRSAFVPLARITGMEMCKSSGRANPDHLRIVYTDPRLGERGIVLGDMANYARVDFNAEMFRKAVESCIDGLAQNVPPPWGTEGGPGEKTVPPQAF